MLTNWNTDGLVLVVFFTHSLNSTSLDTNWFICQMFSLWDVTSLMWHYSYVTPLMWYTTHPFIITQLIHLFFFHFHGTSFKVLLFGLVLSNEKCCIIHMFSLRTHHFLVYHSLVSLHRERILWGYTWSKPCILHCVSGMINSSKIRYVLFQHL